MRNGTTPTPGALRPRGGRGGRASLGVARMPTGISGFDQLMDGGLPRERITLLVGGPGCGKTLFALQTLVNGARAWKEPGIFVAFEERADQLCADAASLGWDLAALRDQQVFFLDAHLPESVILGGEFDLVGLLALLDRKIEQTGARRIVFDGIDMLLGALDSPLSERRELFRLAEWIRRSRLSGIVTCKTDEDGRSPREHDRHLPYLADCVITLQQQPESSVQVRRLRIAKCRGIAHSNHHVPFAITSTGLQVAAYPPPNPLIPISSTRVSTGVKRLDTMLDGGYFQGSSVLISGSPGTAKSTLAASFAESMGRRGVQTLYVTFDERAEEVVRNMSSVGIHLAPHVRSGLLSVVGQRREDRSPEEHIAWIAERVRDAKMRCLIVDPISALTVNRKSIAEDAVARLIGVIKAAGITLLMTSLVVDSSSEISTAGVSTVADTWIHLSYLVRGGERNRALTIIKSRGTHHSKQVRELVLTEQGVDLADVYLAGGEVLMGTMRWQRELAERNERTVSAQKLAQQKRDAEHSAAEVRARLASLQLELIEREAAVAALQGEQENVERSFASSQAHLRRLRTADTPASSAPRGRRNNGTEASR
jgi:circadian clock protein KaiC